MHETMEISHDIGGELNDHTGRLIENRRKMGGIGDDLGKSGKIVRTMMNRIRKNKFILFSVLGLIFLVIIILAGIHFSKQQWVGYMWFDLFIMDLLTRMDILGKSE